jgi:hypothetical protein
MNKSRVFEYIKLNQRQAMKYSMAPFPRRGEWCNKVGKQTSNPKVQEINKLDYTYVMSGIFIISSTERRKIIRKNFSWEKFKAYDTSDDKIDLDNCISNSPPERHKLKTNIHAHYAQLGGINFYQVNKDIINEQTSIKCSTLYYCWSAIYAPQEWKIKSMYHL